MRINAKRAVFFVLLGVGVGFVIAGVFVPVLLPVGITCISGAVALSQYQAARAEQVSQAADPVHPRNDQAELEIRVPQCDDSLEVDLHIDHRYRSHRLPKSFNHPPRGPHIEDNSDSKEAPSESIQRPSP